ncbi:MAG: alpha/beta fold hydrolase [Caldilineae bacterium]|nr:MAG: alpha/beta fold hydrolase [Caldilineae bacterium]
MEILRTPDHRFANLPDYPFTPHYVEVPDGEGGALRIHYVDEGDPGAPPVLLMHGEPSWSYLYRKMIPPLAAAGYRAVAPDLVGFGRSDKPARQEDYTYQRHVDWMSAWLHALDLRDITLFAQDWGGLIGLRLLAAEPERFVRVAAANTGLPTGDHPMPRAFKVWQRFVQRSSDFVISRIIDQGTVNSLPDEVKAAYDAPFPDERYKAGARIFPMLVPVSPDDPAAPANRRAWEVLKQWHKPFLTLFSDSDPITRGGERLFQELVPGARGQPHTIITQAGHFLQEDRGQDIAALLIRFMRGTGA